MKEITVVTTVEATDIIRFEDSPDAYEGILNFMGKARKDIADSAAKQFAESDDVNVKVQFFVDDRDEAGSDKPAVKFRLKDCRNCKRRDECSSGDIVAQLFCILDGFSQFVPDDSTNAND